MAAAFVLWTIHRRNAHRAATSDDSTVEQGRPVTAAVTLSATDARTLGTPVKPTVSGAEILPFLVELGEAMINSGDPVTHVTRSLEQVAQVNGIPDAEIVVLATALIISLPGEEVVQTAVAAAGSSRLRLDQIDAVFDIVTEAERGEIGPHEGLQRLQSAQDMAPSFGPFVRVLGYTTLSIGIALVLRAGWPDLAVAGVLGAAVGLLQLWAYRLASSYQVLLPVVCAFGVSVAVFLLAGNTSLDLGGFAPLVAPLVTFIPGALLTTAVIELATGQMISGAGRLAAGAMQLVLLAFGILAGAQLVGMPTSSVISVAGEPLGPLGPWIGVAVFGAGVVVYYSARISSLAWIMLVLYVAYAGQVIGGLLFGGILSAFFGALFMTPVAMMAATQKSGPPTMVSFLPAFWLLVPGALGLVGLTQFLGDDRTDGIDSIVTAGATMVGISLGVLLGLGAGVGLATATEFITGRRRQELTRQM